MVYTQAGDFESPASVYVSGIIIRSPLLRERFKYGIGDEIRTQDCPLEIMIFICNVAARRGIAAFFGCSLP
jgi:hypothetical protein